MPASHDNVIPMRASPRLLSWVAAMAEALTLPLLLVRPDGALEAANMAGHRELEQGRRLRRQKGRVQPARPGCDAGFAMAMRRALDEQARVEWPLDAEVADAACERIVIAPITRGPGAPMLMLVLPAEAPMGEACRLFAYQYGLSADELAALYALCRGHTPHQIARQQGVAESTVRRRLARVRRKCGEDSLATLLPRVRALPPLDASGWPTPGRR